MKYSDFVKRKEIASVNSGFEVDRLGLNEALFPFQNDCVSWALRKGKAALFQDCGFGKAFEQLEWARCVHEHAGGSVLVLAPLAVSRQTKSEGDKFGVRCPIKVCESQRDVIDGINITNYQKLHKFDPKAFVGVVLDESSLLKSFEGKFRNLIIESFAMTPYKLACTATPSPNDFMELGNHSEFLNVMSRTEMLSMFFVNDSGDTGKWRLKKHAQDEFWKWVCSWAVYMRKPSDLGYEDGDFVLPELRYNSITVKSGRKRGLGIVVPEAKTLSERREARRSTVDARVAEAAGLANDSRDMWLVYCDTNLESQKLSQAITDAVEVKGSDPDEHKASSMIDFAAGKIRVLVSKPTICGFGMNFQACHKVAFVGLSDSFEQFYQAVRRCWRFGQKNPVDVYVITSDLEGAVVRNIKRKESDANRMAEEMVKNMSDISSVEIRGTVKDTTEYDPKTIMEIPKWLK